MWLRGRWLLWWKVHRRRVFESWLRVIIYIIINSVFCMPCRAVSSCEKTCTLYIVSHLTVVYTLSLVALLYGHTCLAL
jgi:hypothetical protein